MEARLRALLGTLDRRLNRLYFATGAAWILTAPVAVAALGEVWSWWTALLCGVGGSAAVLGVLAAGGEAWLGRRSARSFNEQFREGTPERTVALDMLAEMRSLRKKAEGVLQNALASLSPADAVVRHKATDPHAEVQAALGSLGGSPPAPPQPPSPPPAEPVSPVRRSSGAYDYIPLEPRAAGEHGPTSASGEEPPIYIPLDPRTEPREER
jgi:hypothetical protein